MRRIRIITVLLSVLAAACSSGVEEAPALLRTVPSRSIEVMHFRHAGKALEMLLDSTHVFRSLDLGRLEGSEMVLSYDYSSTLVPLLSLDAGRYRTDSSETVKSILAQAEALRLQAAYVVDTARRTTALLISPSTASISEALIHIKSGASVLDAKGFTEALTLAKGDEGFILLSHSAGGHIAPRGFLGQELPKGFLSRFIYESTRWTVLNFDSYRKKDISVDFSPVGPEHYYLSIFKDLKGGDSRVGRILPEGTDWVIDLPLRDWEAFYDARCRWLDGTSRYKIHIWNCEDLEKLNKLSPQDWCRRIRPQEVSVIQWDGHKVIALRVKKAAAKMQLTPNPLRDYTAEMFGRLFKEPEESVCSTMGRWMVFGSPEDVSAFAEAPRPEKALGFGKKIKYVIYRPEWQLIGSDKGVRLNTKEE